MNKDMQADSQSESVADAETSAVEQKLSELEILRQSLEEAKKKESELNDRLLRTLADFDNFRKRAESRIAAARSYAKEEMLFELLTIADALDQAQAQCQQANDLSSVQKGVSLVQQQFSKFLRDQGLTPIAAVGERLDPHRHEAISQVPSPDTDDGVILSEFQKGYLYSDRVLRTAKVQVAVKPVNDSDSAQSTAPSEETEG